MIVNKKESNTFNQNILNQIGNTDISKIGDGTLTGAVSTINDDSIKNISDSPLYFKYFMFDGDITAGQITNLGSFTQYIPAGYNFVAMFLTPHANVHISMSYLLSEVFAYSETYTGTFNYDVLMVLTK